MAEDGDETGAVELITNPDVVKHEIPVITIRTPQTEGQKFFLRVKQPQGRALLVAVHL